MEHYKYYKHFTTFQKNITNITIQTKKTAGTVSYVKEKKNLLTNFHVSKKGKTPAKVPFVKNRRNCRRSVMS